MNKKILRFLLIIVLIIIFSACSSSNIQSNTILEKEKNSGEIYLYGERHGIKAILDKEFEIWKEYYNKDNMRHLFIENPYYTAEYLNLWMKSKDDEILGKIYSHWENTASHKPAVKEFYKKIKKQCPETIFHGTDVGHQFRTIGKDYLKYLENKGLEASEEYKIASENIKQGEKYYSKLDDVYRENTMVINFISEFEKLDNEKVMGIYGGAHTGLDSLDFTNSVASMGKQLKKRYGNAVKSEDLTIYMKDIEPLKEEKITINDKDYNAYYYGKHDFDVFEEFSYREFWYLEDSYKDFSQKILAGNVLPYNNYPIKVEKGRVYVIDYTKLDGTVIRKYYRSDGNEWNGMLTTEEFLIKE